MAYRFLLLELCGFEDDIYRSSCDISEIEILIEFTGCAIKPFDIIRISGIVL